MLHSTYSYHVPFTEIETIPLSVTQAPATKTAAFKTIVKTSHATKTTFMK